MNTNFKEMLLCLNELGVKYLIVGGYAIIEYTEPRYTKDLDIWVEADSTNAKKLINALGKFGAPLYGATAEDFSVEGNILQIGIAPIRIDIISSIDGVSFLDAWDKKVEIDFDGVKTYIISAEDLLKNKKASKRQRDNDEAKVLELAMQKMKKS